MPQKEEHVSDAELGVLEVLWERGKATVREIANAVCQDQSFSKYQSVQKLLERLEKKRCVKRFRSKPAHSFQAIVDREKIIARRLEDVAATLCGGSLTPLLMHLAERTKLKSEERKALQELIDKKKK